METGVPCYRRMKLSLLISSCILLPVICSAQRFTFGGQGGFPAQTPLGQTNGTMPFALGPTAEIRIFSGLSFSTGVLFSRAGRRIDSNSFLVGENVLTYYYESVQSHAVEVPLLAKYRFFAERRALRPFVNAGATVRRTSIETTTLTSSFSNVPSGSVLKTKTVSWNADPTAGAGVDLRAGRFHLEPEVRYSYWGAGKNTLVRKNQVHFLLGFRF
jgi:hypothetical protein